ncbi:transglycosylase SLT domain-containing protein [Bradyrhizobium sp.]|uniref:lytic transglycosylase domain-containing protein n=1 Tax=Bradyrhizobium sp. TaxID=376 RepID=UPI0025BDB4AF|nr:transglycosylase SLT domain-containing protein [Bradyrhizobium sp.]
MKYPVEILLGFAGIAAVAQPIFWPITASGEAERPQPAITAPQPAQPPSVEPLQRTQQAALTDDVWQPERMPPAAARPQQTENAPPPEKSPPSKRSRRAALETLIAAHAKANDVPQALVHRVIVRESRYQPDLVGRGGTIGLMQIKLATARGLGYRGDAIGLRDPDTNLAFGVKYLAGAYRAANGDHDRAIHYYARGYYEVAKLQRQERPRVMQAGPVLASVPPNQVAMAKPEEVAKPEETAKPVEVAKPVETAKPVESVKPEQAAAAPKQSALPKAAAAKPKKEVRNRLAEYGEPVPRPPANIPTGANSAKRVDTSRHRPTLALFRGELR